MNRDFFHFARASMTALLLILGTSGGYADSHEESRHGLAMYGEPALAEGFNALPYVNANAPKGGEIRLGNPGSFDSLNPYIQRGNVPWQLRFFGNESLMARSQDEPFTLYGLLAESVRVAEDRSWVEFALRDSARFSDGSPVTIDDVIWSFETLGTQGHGRYQGFWRQVDSLEAIDDKTVRFTFNSDNRELALLAGLRPVLKKAQWEGKDFANARIDDIPISSGPYVISDYDAGRFVKLTRNPDYWGNDLPVRKGHNNFDDIRIEFYGDSDVLFEAFKGGELSAIREFNASKWDTQFDFPRISSGDVVKTVVPHGKPSGITGFVMNTRRPPFDDWRVRQALIEMFNFNYISAALTGGQQPRISSYFSNSPLAFEPGPAKGRVAQLLEPFASDLLPGTLDGYELPEGSKRARDRGAATRATELLGQAGWTPGSDGKMQNGNGDVLSFEILLTPAATEARQIATIYVEALSTVGIDVVISPLDSAQYNERTAKFDFDMSYYRRAVSLSPGTEQRFYWGSESAVLDGSRNWMGAEDPAIDAMIMSMLSARDTEDFNASVKALDRLLMAGRYVVPFWTFAAGRIAHVKEMKFPDTVPLYGDGPNYLPEIWWWKE
ncbi:MAG: extracellular solute-binding protein [Paracoccaceae bacterium]